MTIEPGVEYWPGNYLRDHPSGNMKRRCVDNGDGTATETLWGEDGVVLSEQTVPYEPPIVAVAPDPLVLLAEVGADLAAIPVTATSTQMRTALRTVGQKITDAIEA